MNNAALYTHQYFDIKPGHSRRRETEIRWQDGLPARWADQVLAPLYFDHYLDYSMAAARILGRDENDEACYCAHSFVLEAPADPIAPGREPSYAENLRAWRLRDGRWLIHRVIVPGSAREETQGFYTLSEHMPR